MAIELPHLVPEARSVANLDVDARIEWLLRPRWIGYPQAKQILDRLDQLFRHPRMHRMPNLLVLGHTNNGKTTIVLRFADLHPPNENPSGSHLIYPVMVVQMPPVPDESRFYDNILDKLHQPFRAKDPVSQKERQVKYILSTVELRMLIVDEVHHLLAGRPDKQRAFLNTLKYLGNELQIPIVAVGTLDAIRAIQIDPQLANRFKPVTLTK